MSNRARQILDRVVMDRRLHPYGLRWAGELDAYLRQTAYSDGRTSTLPVAPWIPSMEPSNLQHDPEAPTIPVSK